MAPQSQRSHLFNTYDIIVLDVTSWSLLDTTWRSALKLKLRILYSTSTYICTSHSCPSVTKLRRKSWNEDLPCSPAPRSGHPNLIRIAPKRIIFCSMYRLCRYLKILVRPLFCVSPSYLLRLLNGLPGLNLAPHQDITKTFIQQIPLRLEQAKRVL